MAGAAGRPLMPDLDTLGALWRTRERVVLLQAGFGDGSAFLKLWQAWQDGAPPRAKLVVIAIDPASIGATGLRRAHSGSPVEVLADRLAVAWPPMTRNLHCIDLAPGRLQLLLARGQVLDWLIELQAQVDVFLIDGTHTAADPLRGPQRLAKALARLAAPHARLWADTAALTDALADALAGAGFARESGAGAGLHAVYRPRHGQRPPTLAAKHPEDRHALIVGAGLAGSAIACALAEQGWCSTLIEACDRPAAMASGNPAGLFHGVVHRQDGAHARFNRAAALQARLAVQQAIDKHGAPGQVGGVLRLESRLPDRAAMQAVLDALPLPPDYVQALDAAEAGARCALPLQRPAWFYPGGGWVQPAALARSFLQRAGVLARFRGGVVVQGLRRNGDQWCLLDAAGQVIAQASTVVLAHAADAIRLLDASHWPLRRVRGQISLFDNAHSPASQRLALPRIALAGAGYLLPPVGGLAVFGASAQPDDNDSHVRAADHAFNLRRLQALTGQRGLLPKDLSGRVGWRLVADDRLPLVGAVPDEVALRGQPVERLRDVQRRTGLYVFTALASRGIGWAALGGQVLAAQIAAAPLPLEATLLRAVDPARFVLRSARRAPR